HASGRAASSAVGSAASIRSCGSVSMMTPVENGSTCSAPQPTRRASASHVERARARPSAPVPALALPVLTSSARTSLTAARCSRQSCTGAAQKRFDVKTPATAAPGSIVTTRTSRRFALRTPAIAVPSATPATGNSAFGSGGARWTAMAIGGVAGRAIVGAFGAPGRPRLEPRRASCRLAPRPFSPSTRVASFLPSPAHLFDAHTAPARREHELAGAWPRVAGCLCVAAVWGYDHAVGRIDAARETLLAVDAIYLALALAYLLLLRRERASTAAPLYFFLVGDALFLTAILALDPRSFAFTDPLLFVVILRDGIHYGLRTMYLSWAAALAASLLFFADPSWVDRIELVLTFFITLALVPVFFASLIQRIHALRAIEEERAQLAAINDAIAARSAFLARVSHELRSPLQGIVSALDVLALRQGPRARADDELLQRIRRSSLLLNTHLRDLLTLAKGEAGHLELRPEPFDACALVESVAASALDFARAKKLELVVDVPPEAVFVVADAARIDQILTNLLINSIRY